MRAITSRLLLGVVLGSVSSLALATTVNVNSANVATLADHLNGVDRATAQAIVNYRVVHGPLTSESELLHVEGIGLGVLEANMGRMRTQ